MTLKEKDNHFYCKPEKNSGEIILKKFQQMNVNMDVVIDLSEINTLDKILADSLFSVNEMIRSKGFSLVLVLKSIPNFPNFDSLTAVPTLVEAEDYVQMEQIQRDLGISL
jgi:hypothetical protein